ncbi:helix-turn-helix domain-containing protein [Intestinibacillus massiliensis]|nr:helix-turn-helix domain-containing protein [Intestinibacillus massiliensis]
MAAAKYRKWLEPDGLTRLAGWARDGLTQAQVAGRLGVSLRTLAVWQRRFPEIADALRRGKEVVDYEVENALLQSALGGSTTAQIFWLKNRKPDKFREKPLPSGGEGVRIYDDV